MLEKAPDYGDDANRLRDAAQARARCSGRIDRGAEFADAAGVLRGGNTVVFRIGADALGTAQAIVAQALDPALAAALKPA